MSKKIKITDFKTERINQFTGGKLGLHVVPGLQDGDGDMPNSFLSQKGEYIGDYAMGWWYVRKNMLVCNDYPCGVALVLNKPAKDCKSIGDYKVNGYVGSDDIEGYYGYSHRGGNLFKIGDRLFDINYKPKEEDYTKEEWEGFKKERTEYIAKNLKEGWFDTEEEALADCPISSVIPFKKRGAKYIETWGEAKQAAINMSRYLS